MPLTRTETQITWATANTITLNSAIQQTSDPFIFDPTDISASLQINANNQGTPALGDNVNVRIAWTTGDILLNTGDDYDTGEHAQLITILDTYPTDSPGENPARRTLDIPTSAKGFKVYVDAPQAATRNIIVGVRLSTQRAS